MMEMFQDTIIQGDCLETLKTFPDELVDLIITSPPYNIGNDHHTGSKRTQAYFDDIPESKYQAQQVKMLTELYRILKTTGSLFYNHKNRIRDGLTISPYQWIFKTKFLLKQEIVWVNGSQNLDKIRFYPFSERVYWLAKNQKTILQNNLNLTDVVSNKRWPAQGTNKKHARTYPIRFPRDIITMFPDAKLILDPYCGSGTTCLAAKELGRHYIGIELDQNYAKYARQRIEGYQPLTTYCQPQIAIASLGGKDTRSEI